MSTWRDQPPERQLADWIQGWTVARSKHGDMRLWLEQQSGYQDLDREWASDNGQGASGYDWSGEIETRGLMPRDNRETYIEEGRELRAGRVLALMTGGAPQPAPTPEPEPVVAAVDPLDDIPF